MAAGAFSPERVVGICIQLILLSILTGISLSLFVIYYSIYKNAGFNAPQYFLPLKQNVHGGGGDGSSGFWRRDRASNGVACFAGAKFSRCTLIKTLCLELHRDVPPQIAQV